MTTRRAIPLLPRRPRVHPISGQINRSYPVGHQSFSRAHQGQKWELTISTGDSFPDNIKAAIVTSLNAKEEQGGNVIPFTLKDANTLTCTITPEQSGFYDYRAVFSLDGGHTWLRDNAPDAWVFVDPPQVDNLRLYTLIPSISGTIDEWTADLGRIKGMGFNAIHLLPVTPMDTSESPYSAKDLFGLDYSYLRADSQHDALYQLEEFVAAARAIGIRLCFDLVFNHVGVDSLMVNDAPDWIVPDEQQPDGLKRAQYWSDQGWLIWEDIVLINYEHPSAAIRSEIWAYMIQYGLFWAKYANDTGGFVRFDNLHSSDNDFILALTTTLHATYPEVAVIAEYFTDDSTLLNAVPRWGLNLVMATPWQFKFVPQLRSYLIDLHRVSEHVRYFMPITSHDSGSPAQEFGTSDSTVPRYVAAALLGTGCTGIPQGVEWAASDKIDFIGRSRTVKHAGKPKFAEFIGVVNFILDRHPTFRSGGNCHFVDEGHPAVVAAVRHSNHEPLSVFVVVCNFDSQNSQQFGVNLSEFIGAGNANCVDLLSGDDQAITNSRLDICLAPCGAHVFEIELQDGHYDK